MTEYENSCCLPAFFVFFLQLFFPFGQKTGCSLYVGCLHCVQALRRALPSLSIPARATIFCLFSLKTSDLRHLRCKWLLLNIPADCLKNIWIFAAVWITNSQTITISAINTTIGYSSICSLIAVNTMFENFPWYARRWFSDLSGDFLKRISLLQAWFNQGPLWMSEMCHRATHSANPPGWEFVKLNAPPLQPVGGGASPSDSISLYFIFFIFMAYFSLFKCNSSVCLIKRNQYLFRGCVYFYNRHAWLFYDIF